MRALLALTVAAFMLIGPQNQAQTRLQYRNAANRTNSDHANAVISERVRHELALLPYYGVFDWIEGQVAPNDTVVLRGEVIRPTTKSDAEARVKRIESVAHVVNQIQVLPLSPSDDETRIATYRAIFKYNGPLFRYSTSSRPSIHIIVKNGRVTLKGFVADATDSQIAYMFARGVPFVFEVKNELQVLKS